MDLFFQRHFGRRQKRPKHFAAVRHKCPSVQASKARRRSSVGLASVALVQSRRSSVGLPLVCTDQRRRPSVGLLVASGQKRQSIIELGLTNASEGPGRGTGTAEGATMRGRHRPCCSVSCARRSKVKSIEPHLLGSSMLLASVVQMGTGLKKEEEDEEDMDVSPCSCSESGEEEESDDEADEESFTLAAHRHLTQAVVTENIKARPLLWPPRCLRRNSSHLLPADSVFQDNAAGFGVFGRYNPLESSHSTANLTNAMSTSVTSPSLGQPAPAGLSFDVGAAAADATSCGSMLHKGCSSPLDGPQQSIYYNPYQDT